MRIELKPFQETAARQLWRHAHRASDEARDGDLQAIVLSSPTGSGKTVTVTQLMEWIVAGDESTSGDPEAVFLWLSDSPELNAQSRDKILRQSSVFRESRLVVVEPPFSQERFAGGKVYFLNTQKLGKDSLLTKSGDGRDYTIWQTIQNTSVAKPGQFYLIIDEAHRGMAESSRDRAQAASIVQRFIKGYPEGGLQPVKLILGMSATPERFNKVLEGSNRANRPCVIDPEAVKISGLLKDKIVVYFPDENQPADVSLLEEAARRWKRFGKEWETYCAAQKMEHTVEPALVIQVEDGDDKRLTHTNLDEVVAVVERIVGALPEDAWAHAFQEDKTVEAGGRKIRKIEASQIEYDRSAKVVLFKMSLTTGWDCPRAEVMMSFRRARDHTLIAQLVGRMVRTPLARSVEGQDFLNTVSLYLPHYDQQGLQTILERLNAPDPEIGVNVTIEEGKTLVTAKRDPEKAGLFTALETLPTYRLERTTKISETRRLMRVARQLTFDEIDQNTLSEAKTLIVGTLIGELKRLSKKAGFKSHLADGQEIEVREVQIEYGEWKDLANPRTFTVKATPENVEDLFQWCGRQLGEGLHMEFWKSRRDKDNPDKAKLELFGLLQEKDVLQKVEGACLKHIQELFRVYQAAIRGLPTGKQEEYQRLKRLAKTPEPENLRLPPTLEVRKETPLWERHLYIDERGKFGAKLNSWETAVLEEELKKPEVVGWLRNLPRKPWALCVPYDMEGKTKACYPDLMIFRKVRGKIVTDVLDPHDSGLDDAVFKAHGLAEYAKKHGDQFGRIESIVVSKGEIRRLDLTNERTADEVLRARDKAYIDKLFADLG